MSFLRRFLGPNLKMARSAEAQGNLPEALRIYGELGAWSEVVQIQLRLARLESNPQERLNLLRAAAVCAGRLENENVSAKEARATLAEELLRTAKANRIETDFDRRLLEESVQIGTLAGSFGTVGEALYSLGRSEEAAQAFAQAGQIEKMEELYRQIEISRGDTIKIRNSFDAYETAMKTGDRWTALRAIRRCVELNPKEKSFTELRASLEERWLTAGILPLRIEQQRVTIISQFPADIGREVGCRVRLRDTGISRAHARISKEKNEWTLSDLNSRNGTFLQGVAIRLPIALREKGHFSLGEHAAFDFIEQGSCLRLECVRGPDRGSVFLLSEQDVSVPDIFPGTRFSFTNGQGTVSPDGVPHFLCNGQPCTSPVILIEGDEISIQGKRLTVTQELSL